MVRTQIQLTERQASALRRLAAAEGKSLADLIRTAVDLLIGSSGSAPDRAELKRHALAATGAFRSGAGRVATDHDRYLDEAYRG